MGLFIQSKNLASKIRKLNCPLEALFLLTIFCCLEDLVEVLGESQMSESCLEGSQARPNALTLLNDPERIKVQGLNIK